ncbi:hypothetical protein [Salmonirosea aquatica]|uniref:Lipoprotein n=1 Tax=Salmonirosea aquatica TaxID=2654236 RepID=A0A7C9FR48_9BACT|nr:hypothetical protein [Cytophagaceae bacterium SJW1-29]
MKKNLITFAVFAFSVLLMSGCKKKNLDVGFAPEIQKIVPQNVVDDLRARGMTINEGQKPPTIEGVYLASPYELLSPYAPEDSYEKGKIITGYLYRFTGQSDDKKKVQVNYKRDGDVDAGGGLGSFVSGNGNKFTVFAEVQGTVSGVNYTSLDVFSGEITPNGIADFQHTFYIVEKSESDGPNAELIPVNSGRVWFDNDRIAEKVSKYRLAVPEKSKDIYTGSLVGNNQ